MGKPIDREFAAQILQAHIRNAMQLDERGGFRPQDELEAMEPVIMRVWEHTRKLIDSIYDEPEAYGF